MKDNFLFKVRTVSAAIFRGQSTRGTPKKNWNCLGPLLIISDDMSIITIDTTFRRGCFRSIQEICSWPQLLFKSTDTLVGLYLLHFHGFIGNWLELLERSTRALKRS